MDMQLRWIERIFTRLSALYGATFGRQWDGTDLAEVKRTWAEKLGGFTANNIASALNACDDRQYPPNLPEFIELCRRSYVRPERLLESKQPATYELTAEEKQERLRVIESAASKPEGYDFKLWAKKLREDYLSGVVLLPMQIEMASSALGEVWSKRECRAAV